MTDITMMRTRQLLSPRYKLYQLICKKNKSKKPIYFEEVENIYYNDVFLNPATSEGGCIRESSNYKEKKTIAWFEKNIGALVIGGHITVIPKIILNKE